jgi:hypothetical protein
VRERGGYQVRIDGQLAPVRGQAQHPFRTWRPWLQKMSREFEGRRTRESHSTLCLRCRARRAWPSYAFIGFTSYRNNDRSLTRLCWETGGRAREGRGTRLMKRMEGGSRTSSFTELLISPARFDVVHAVDCCCIGVNYGETILARGLERRQECDAPAQTRNAAP